MCLIKIIKIKYHQIILPKLKLHILTLLFLECVADIVPRWSVFPALWGEQEGQCRRLHHQHLRVGERLWIPGSGPLCLSLRGRRRAGSRPREALQWTKTRPASLCTRCSPSQIWRGGGTIQGVPTGYPGWEDTGILLRFPRSNLLPFFLWSALLWRPHL